MRAIERSSTPAGPDGGLDALVVTDRLVAVVDVATPKRASHADALRFRDALIDAIRSVPAGTAPVEAAGSLGEAARAAVVDDEVCAVVALYDDELRVVWRVGDCRVVIGGTEHPPAGGIEAELATIRVAIDAAHLASGRSVAELRELSPGRQAILPVMAAAIGLRNHPEGRVRGRYGAIDGGEVPADLVEELPVPAGAEVVLATDGYLGPLRSLAAAEADVERRATVDPLLLDDPATTKPIGPGSDWFDDRTYVRLAAGAPPGQPGGPAGG